MDNGNLYLGAGGIGGIGALGGLGGLGTMAIQSTIITNVMSKIKSGHVLFDIFISVLISSIFGMVFTNIPIWVTSFYDFTYKNLVYIASQGRSNKEIKIQYVEVLNLKSGVKYRNGTNSYDDHIILALEAYIQENHEALKPSTLKVNLSKKKATNANDYQFFKTCDFTFSNSDPIIKLSNGITLYIDNSEHRTEKTITTVRTITLCTNKTHSFINEFLKTIYNQYVENNYKQFDDEKEVKYFLTLKSDATDSTSKKDYRWRRYNLNIERTFDSIFFPEKKEILSLINDFQNKQGVFGKSSIPYKLSFLLHGTPGTGKTSFLKALANYTNRHIINLPLPLIETNEQLTEVFQNEIMQLHISSDYIRSDNIPMNKRIYVLEDVDVLSDIVKKRDEKKNDEKKNDEKKNDEKKNDEKKNEEKKKKVVLSDDSSDGSSSDDSSDNSSSDNDSSSNNELHNDKSKDKKKQKKKRKKVKKVVVGSGGKKKNVYGPVSHTYGNAYERYCIQEDKLNLSGLLNALDGLLELHGVIIVLTTNHPENLDPALIRPGRITYNLGMTYMEKGEILNMIKYHYPEIASDDLKDIENIECNNISPATVENMCLQSKDVSTLKTHFQKYNKENNN